MQSSVTIRMNNQIVKLKETDTQTFITKAKQDKPRKRKKERKEKKRKEKKRTKQNKTNRTGQGKAE